jgi:hypothetical protein
VQALREGAARHLVRDLRGGVPLNSKANLEVQIIIQPVSALRFDFQQPLRAHTPLHLHVDESTPTAPHCL